MSVLVCTCRCADMMVHHTSTIIQSLSSSIDPRVSSTTTANTTPSSSFPHHQLSITSSMESYQRHALDWKKRPTSCQPRPPSRRIPTYDIWILSRLSSSYRVRVRLRAVVIFVEAPIGGGTAYRGHDDRHALPPHRASHSSFPSSNSSFMPPPMPAKHEYTSVKRASAPSLNKVGKVEDIDQKRPRHQRRLRYPPSSRVLTHMPNDLAPTHNSSPPTPTSINISISTTPSTSASAKLSSLSSSRPAPAFPSVPHSRRQSLSSKRHSQLSQSYQSSANSRRASIFSTASITSTSNNTNTTQATYPIPPRIDRLNALPALLPPHLPQHLHPARKPLRMLSPQRHPHPCPTCINPWPNPHPRLCLPHPRPAAHNVWARHSKIHPQVPQKYGPPYIRPRAANPIFARRFRAATRRRRRARVGGADEYESEVDYAGQDADADADAEDGDEEGPLPPGIYLALFDFEPEGTAEMAWAVVIREESNASTAGEKAEKKSGEGAEEYVLVPESYLKFVRGDEEEEGDEEENE
ncbi:hypothetical protein M422DRAFT_255316 [Sphaerobolus stellatus SS14]|uniref:Uncharacterized protein n=1 Tax=Sphaerobolus stellatus (strain SS14) TaxID=990650 RepID=A0A0C9VT55_SPHS4|nr:hypothetical protein M422DRAFT_255316 [Sphaerobolus stellatus SS14]